VLDYTNSLALRSERVVVDSSKPYAVRVEQTYRPSIQLQPGLRARATLQKRPTTAAAGQPAQPGEIVKDFGCGNRLFDETLNRIGRIPGVQSAAGQFK
jgi:hypothetical protein